MIRFQQNSSDSKAVLTGLFLGRMLYKVVHGSTVKDAFEDAANNCKDEVTSQAVEFVRTNLGKPICEALDAYGVLVHGENKAILGHCCMNPHGFVRVLLTVLKDGIDYTSAVRENIFACGGNCEAAIMIGSLLAVKAGVPEELAAKYNLATEMRSLIENTLMVANQNNLSKDTPVEEPTKATAEKTIEMSAE